MDETVRSIIILFAISCALVGISIPLVPLLEQVKLEIQANQGGPTPATEGIFELTNCTPDSILARKLNNQQIIQDLKLKRDIKRPVLVAVIDTGADIAHPDLTKSIWTNPGETGMDFRGKSKESNNIDDDGNGYIDDVHGWNFVSNNNDLSDHSSHGTHVAGIIKSNSDDGSPSGLKMMILKYYDPTHIASNNLENTVAAINYAVKMNVKIINYSGGGTVSSEKELVEIKNAEKAGILFVAAAGNEYSDSDEKPYYPADYKLSNILSVAAVNQQLRIIASSNYGKNSVDTATFGENICSSFPDGSHSLMTGTSQAAAMATGAAVLLLSRWPNLLPSDLKLIITSTSKQNSSLLQKSKSNGILDLKNAASLLDYLGGLN